MAPAPQTKQGGAADLAYGEMADDDAAMHKKAYSMFVGFFSLQSMNAMVNTMNVVPMLCILMIFARLRATSDLHTSPQPYARGFFIVTALCVYIQALLAVFFPKSGKGCCYWVGKILDWTATLILYVQHTYRYRGVAHVFARHVRVLYTRAVVLPHRVLGM
jgi:hypothetical protein